MKNYNDLEQMSPSGICKMGSTDVTYYRTDGGRVWFDKLAIEFVLTGKNQHNLLGQYKDHRNHGRIFDTERKEAVEVISPTGVKNYLSKARSVSEENRHAFYHGLKSMDKTRKDDVSEPIQMPMFNASVSVAVNPFIKISELNGLVNIDYTINGKNPVEKRQNLAKMLISAANAVLTGNESVKLKEVA